MVVVVRPASAQSCTNPSFAAPTSNPVPLNPPGDLVVGDFNRDGNLDVAVSNGTQISVFTGNGTGAFTGRIDSPALGTTLGALAAGDLDRDGDLDLVVADNQGTNERVERLSNNGSGTFTSVGTIYSAGASTSVDWLLMADFNRDGRLDVVIADVGFPLLELLLQNTVGGFVAPPTGLLVGIMIGQPVVADFNRDGKLDIAVPNPEAGGSLLYFAGDGVWDQASPPLPQPRPFGPLGNAAVAGDFNRDGIPDVVVADQLSSNVYFVRGNGDGTFGLPQAFSLSGRAGKLAVADFDRDGDLDLAATIMGAPGGLDVLLGSGAGGFAAPNSFGSTVAPVGIGVGDLNEDGKPDLVDVFPGSGRLLESRRNTFGISCPNPSFAPAARTFGAGTGPVGISRGDFNADGRLDLVTANSSSNNVTVLLSIGPNSFSLAGNFAAGTGPRFPAVGDFDNDGDFDLAVSNPGASAVSVLVNTGAGSFAPPTTIALAGGAGPAGIAVGDLDNDGDLDLAVSLTNSQVALLKGSAGANFAAPTFVTTGVGTTPSWVTTGDFTGDGNLDLGVSDNSAQNQIVFLRGRGDLTFDPPGGTSVSPSVGPNFIVAADFNKDGRLDLATSNLSSNSACALLGNGGGGFALQPSVLVGGGSPQSLDVADLNLDGNLDLVTANSASDNVSVLLGLGGGSFSLLSTFPAAGQPMMAISGDYNADGIEDVVAADNTSNSVVLLINTGNGFPLLQAAPRTAFSATPRGVATGDFNRDGIFDLAIPGSDPNDVSLFRGAGDGSFTLASTIVDAGVTDARQVAVADFNRDGIPDLAVLFFSKKVQIYFGVGNFGLSFTPGPSRDTSNDPHALVAGDFDRDGSPDFAHLNDEAAAADSVWVWLNDGTGSAFTLATPSPTLGVGEDPRHLVAGDFNRDAFLDLATANSSTGRVSLFRGAGAPPGTFAPPVTVTFATKPVFLATEDWDFDGDLDLAVADETAGQVRMLRNDTPAGSPSLTFNLGPTIVTPSGPTGIESGDFNDDGKPDLAVAAKGVRSVSVFPGLGSMTFSSPTHYGTGSGIGGPNAVAAGDWNRDGKPDLVATDDSTATFSVLMDTNCKSRRLEVAIQPSACNLLAPSLLSLQPRLRVTDDGGNLNQCDAGMVSPSLVSGPVGAVLGGASPVSVINGNADFASLSVDLPGPGYRLGFSHALGFIARSRRFTAAISVGITGPPTVCSSAPSTFAAAPPLFERYAWMIDGSPIPGGATVVVPPQTPVLHLLSLQATTDGCTVGASQNFLPENDLSSVTLNVGPGSTAVCSGPACLGAIVSLTEVGGGPPVGRQWGFRLVSGPGPITDILSETGATYQIQGSHFPGPGTYYLVETTNPTCGALVVSDELQVIVFATAAGPKLPVITATSKNTQNRLEWLNPTGPYEGTLIKYNQSPPATSGCTPPSDVDPGEGTTLTLQGSPALAGERDFKLHDTLLNNTGYCYTAFAEVGTGLYAIPGKQLRARPFDHTTSSVKFAFSTGVATLSAPGMGAGVIHFVDQDGTVHSVVKGLTGGAWAPAPWKPPVLPLPSQTGRPGSIPVLVSGESPVLFLSSQDGHVYAFSAANGTPVWSPQPLLGSVVQAAPSGVFTAFGGSRNLILVGSRNAGANSFFGLDIFNDGSFSVAPGWSYAGDIPFGQIGMINGQAAVDQTTNPPRVYFASQPFGGTNTLWCLNLETGAPIWATAAGPISVGVTLSNDTLYVGLDGGGVMAYNTDGTPKWTGVFPTPATIKGFVYADRLSDDLYFAAGNLLYSVADDGGGLFGWTENWPGAVTFTGAPSTPIVIPQDPQQLVYVGGDGRLFRRKQSDGSAVDEFVLGDGLSVAGSPTVDVRDGFVYLGTEAGVVYGIKLP